MDVAGIGGSPIEITVSGVKVKFAPLTLGDLSDFEAWAGGMYLDNAMRIVEDADAGDRLHVFDVAWSKGQEHANAMMGTMRGIRMLLWLSVRQCQPEMTIEDIGRLVTTQNLSAMNKLVDLLSGSALPEDSDRPPVQEAGAVP